MKNETKNRNIGLDLLRGASILYIVGFWHMLNYTKTINKIFISYRLTYIILGTFVFVSGYFIGQKNLDKGKQNIILFYKKKLLRIYPLYLSAIVLFTIFQISDPTTSIKAAFILSMFAKPPLLTLWFIAMLMSFYIISPFITVACRTMHIGELILYCSLLIGGLLAYGYLTHLLDIRIVVYFPSFVMGVFVASNKNKYVFKNNYIFYSLIVFCILASFIKTNHSKLDFLLNTPMVVLCSYFLFRVSKGMVVSSIRVYKIIIFLSYSSYCMYLFHRPIYSTLKNFYFPETYLFQVIYLVLFCLPCILLFSFIIQRLYDKTSNSLTNKFSGRKKNHAADLRSVADTCFYIYVTKSIS